MSVKKKNDMKNEPIKLELIEWLTQLEDQETIEYLKIVKDSKMTGTDWWTDLPNHVKQGINRSIEDRKNNRLTPHKEVEEKYGLRN